MTNTTTVIYNTHTNVADKRNQAHAGHKLNNQQESISVSTGDIMNYARDGQLLEYSFMSISLT